MNNLGIALGAAAKQWNEDDQLKQRQQAIDLQKAQDARQAEQFEWQRLDQAEKLRQREAENSLSAKYKPWFEASARGDYSFAPQLIGGYNKNEGAFNDGHSVFMQTTPQGQIAHVAGPDGNVVRSVQLNPQAAAQMLQEAYMLERAGLGGSQFKDYVSHSLDARKVGATETQANAVMQKVRTDERWRQFQERQPTMMQDGTGRIVAIDTTGMRQLGAFGSARPDHYGEPSAAARTPSWQPIGQDVDGTVVFQDKVNFDPRTPGKGFIRADGQPVQDLTKLYQRMTGERPALSPEENKEYRKALLEHMQSEPKKKFNMFGVANNQAEIDAWKKRGAQINAIYGVTPQQSAADVLYTVPGAQGRTTLTPQGLSVKEQATVGQRRQALNLRVDPNQAPSLASQDPAGAVQDTFRALLERSARMVHPERYNEFYGRNYQ